MFPWATSGGFDDNWLEGLGLAGLGLLGALVTVYLFLGEFLPSMGGKAEYEEGKLELEDLEKRRASQFELRERFARGEGNSTAEQLGASTTLTDSLDEAISQKQTALTQQRRRLVAIGMPIYLVLGGAFAVLFASNALQGLLIGFGWTAVADRLGLNRELATRTAKREELIGELREDAQKAGQAQADHLAAQARAEKLAQSSEALALALREEAATRKAAQEEAATANKHVDRLRELTDRLSHSISEPGAKPAGGGSPASGRPDSE